MKILCALIFIGFASYSVAQSHETRASDKNIFLHSAMAKRCERYVPREESLCEGAVSALIKNLDYDYIILEKKERSPNWIPKSFVFAAFKKDLVQFLSEPRTAEFLSDVELHINNYLVSRAQFNLWDLALKHYKTSFEASRALASLFQDTSMKKLHLGYLYHARIRGSVNFEDNKNHLARTIDVINQLFDFDEEAWKVLYPTFVKDELKRNIYHFYVPFHIAQRLKARNLTTRATFLGPLMMTLSYEFITTTRNLDHVFKDPEVITNVGTHYDIMAGYLGAFFGNGRTNPVRFSALQNTFISSTAQGVALLVKP